MTEPTVLVVGGGPVGLVVGCELRARGLDVRVIDRVAGVSPHSRAIVVWPRSLELLRRVGVASRIVAAGHRLDDIAYYSDGRLLGTIHLGSLRDTPYPYGVTIPQVRTEQVLRERYAELGGRLDRGVTLTGLQQVDGLPVATLRHGDGTTEVVRPQWLVGADGGRSTVRELLGVPFPGTGSEVLFAIGDGHVGGELDQHAMLYAYARQGALGVAPLGGGVFRVAFSVPEWPTDAAPERELFQRKLDDLAPMPLRMADMRWSTVFRARRRLAETFRSGRCLLAGDAAHVFSAAGAQGMNTGIQDGISLGWRLAGVIGGELDERVLDRYTDERRPHAARVSVNTERQTTWGLLRRRPAVLTRDLALRAADRAGLLDRWGAPLMSQTDVSYRHGRGQRIPGTRLHVGDRLPVFAAEPDGAVDDPAAAWPVVDGRTCTVLLWRGGDGTGTDGRWAEALVRLHRMTAGALPVADVSGVPALRPIFGEQPLLLLVRPDGHLAAYDRGGNPGAVPRLLAEAGVLGGPTPPAGTGRAALADENERAAALEGVGA